MAKSRPLTIQFPSGGVSKRFGYHKQAPYTTPSADNVWPTQWETGREREGVRPGLTAITGDLGAVPYSWCEATWVDPDDGISTGVAVVHANGVSVRKSGDSSWEARIVNAPGTDFTSCAVYLQKLYMAVGGSSCSVNDLQGVAGFGFLEDTVTPGVSAPQNCGIVVAWGDRLVLAGQTDAPQIVYMSRVGNAADWDYSAVDAGAAWANNGDGRGGLVGEAITALISHNTDCLLVASADSVYAIRGNPILSTRPIYSLTREVGVLSQNAWCKTGNDFTVFMSRDGLYSMRPGCGEPPVSMSREVLPQDLTAINPGAGDKVSLGYDVRWRGIHIYVNFATGTDVHYFYDMATKSFWPMSFSVGTMGLAVNLKSASSATKSGLLACHATTGVCYQFDSESTEEIDSHLYYGPIAIGSPHGESVLSEVTSVLSEDSGNVAWSIYSGDSPQEAFNKSATFTGRSWNRQGLNYMQNPLVRGSAAYIKVEDVNQSRWSIEEIPIVVRQAGRRRVG